MDLGTIHVTLYVTLSSPSGEYFNKVCTMYQIYVYNSNDVTSVTRLMIDLK